MNYEIKLPLFEGPFDLLLFFIERAELDIYDIPIFKITTDFSTSNAIIRAEKCSNLILGIKIFKAHKVS